ncbi:glucosamine-6-phosphate deaminase [Paracoccus sp. (in: a-proteobacteria)]|uniref:glucosamine-6-phosphate deaminase n=1 Tax=Paracoccus sp. TaxID=267 RepID=UPI0026DEEDC0|nr:glucosamine-6-phosphate deaminase [Paracoccus sp. (in: a-proteobacteria)]MDO5646556.1 glucosamine-6-phosphate deaminase [Paracoccus sp. (in: a-proteobacteria)]
MKVLILPTPEQAVRRAADIVAEAIFSTPKITLGLATGGTMVPLYRELRADYMAGLSFAGVTSFNLDEYVGLAPDHMASYHYYMRDVLFDHVDIDPANTHLPRGDAPDPVAEADRYDAAIRDAGGIDLQLLGIGQNGHIGFNEPTSSMTSRTRIKTLTASTRAANRPYFDTDDQVPRLAITMGVGTISDARHCLLLATGDNKAQAVAQMVEGPLSAACPASILQMHRHATVVLDTAAAAGLRLTDYYEHVHPGGQDPVI